MSGAGRTITFYCKQFCVVWTFFTTNMRYVIIESQETIKINQSFRVGLGGRLYGPQGERQGQHAASAGLRARAHKAWRQDASSPVAHPAAKSVHLPPSCETQVIRLRNDIQAIQICGHAAQLLRAPGNSAQCHCLLTASAGGGSGKGGDLRSVSLASGGWPIIGVTHQALDHDLSGRMLGEAVLFQVPLQRASINRGLRNH